MHMDRQGDSYTIYPHPATPLKGICLLGFNNKWLKSSLWSTKSTVYNVLAGYKQGKYLSLTVLEYGASNYWI